MLSTMLSTSFSLQTLYYYTTVLRRVVYCKQSSVEYYSIYYILCNILGGDI